MKVSAEYLAHACQSLFLQITPNSLFSNWCTWLHLKNLYGLKQAPRAWFAKLRESMQSTQTVKMLMSLYSYKLHLTLLRLYYLCRGHYHQGKLNKEK